jgi:hypothetical protein
MLWTRKIIVLVFGLLAAFLGGGQETRASDDGSAQSRVATASRPAEVSLKAGPRLVSSSPALRLTLRPTEGDPDSPFLAQIFAADLSGTKEQGSKQLLGVVSFFPVKLGQAQVFVLPAPQHGFPAVAPQNVQLIVKLIAANPARSLDNTSVEVVSALFAE